MGDLGAKAAERKKRTEKAKKENQTIDFFTREHGSGGKNRYLPTWGEWIEITVAGVR